jgi:Domain of unknown function (DUF4129)
VDLADTISTAAGGTKIPVKLWIWQTQSAKSTTSQKNPCEEPSDEAPPNKNQRAPKMNQPPEPPENETRIHQLLKHPTPIPEKPSLGEILLPFLFAAIEATWIDAILIGLSGFGLFQTYHPLVPLWSPFVLLLGTQIMLTVLVQYAAKSPSSSTPSTSATENDDIDNNPKTTIPGAPLCILSLSLTILFITWISLYSQSTLFIDPRWLFSLLNDILLFNQPAYHFFSIVALSLSLCWRGVRLLYRDYEPSHVFSELRLGLGVIIAVILVRAGQANAQLPLNNELTLLLLLPIFLFLSLAAHALARISFVRHNHPIGLEGDISTQERSVLATIVIVGIALFLITWLIGTTASSAILAQTQIIASILLQAYDVITQAFAFIIAILLTPLFWLFSWWFSLFPPKFPRVHIPNRPQQKSNFVPLHNDVITAAVLPFIKVIIPVLLLVAAILIIRWIVRRRRTRQATGKRLNLDLRESLFSWNLFWTQFRALLLSLFRRFFPEKALEQTSPALEEIQGEPTARTIREIYRALLKGAATRGYPRNKNETPNEFQQRLDEKTPLAEPQLTAVTNAYTATRYGGIIPNEAEVTHVRQQWSTLEQKWRDPPKPSHRP